MNRITAVLSPRLNVLAMIAPPLRKYIHLHPISFDAPKVARTTASDGYTPELLARLAGRAPGWFKVLVVRSVGRRTAFFVEVDNPLRKRRLEQRVRTYDDNGCGWDWV